LLFSEVRLLLAPLAVLMGLLVPSSTQASDLADVPLNTAVRNLHEGQVIDGVPCLVEDLPVHHIHVHLQIIADGVTVVVPAGIGVGKPWGVGPDGFVATGSCFAWIHTHDGSGVIHLATPEEESFTLGQLFEVWGQRLGPDKALNYRGSVILLVDGRRFNGDPRAVQLLNLDSLVLELGQQPAVPPATYDFLTPRRR
jgi:hypothetical protein